MTESPRRALLGSLSFRPVARLADAWAAGVCPAAGAVAALLGVAPRIGPAGTAIARKVAATPGAAARLEITSGFAFAAIVLVLGAAAGAAPLGWLTRFRKRWVGTLAALGLVAVLGGLRAHWLVFAAPAAVVVLSTLVSGGAVRALPDRWRDARWLAACLACEGACFGVGVWLPFSETSPALLLPSMMLPAALALYAGARCAGSERGWRATVAGLPALALPFAGLARNPTLLPALACIALAVTALVIQRRYPERTAWLVQWARRCAVGPALAAVVYVIVLPWHFRDAGPADLAGHEGQHLGWLNSISFGKLMMADAGFTYGPAREYALALVAWLLGGLTLEHVRLAHVVVNAAGLLCLVGAMRRVCGGQLHLVAIGAVLVLTHSALTSLVIYTATYAFGWADASRAGIATLSVVVALARPTHDADASRRRLRAGGALAALALLYSHDFGLPAVLGTLVGLGLEALQRGGGSARERARRAGRCAAAYAFGIALVAIPFLGVYALRGRLGAFFQGYAWTAHLSGGVAPFGGQAWQVSLSSFASYGSLTVKTDPEAPLGAHLLDYVMTPALAMAGIAHVAAALARRRVVQRTALVAGLTVLSTLVLHHMFLAADPWHAENAVSPGLVLLVALAAGARTLLVRVRRVAVPLGTACAALLPCFWLYHGGGVVTAARLARVAAGEERPSFGKPYHYDGVPRTGDLHVGDEHVEPVRWIREHSTERDPVLCATWLLGGGTEAFLSHRRNPTSFDKPDEVVSPELQRRMLEELERDPPLLVVGDHFDEFGDDVRAFLDKRYHVPPGAPSRPRVVQRN